MDTGKTFSVIASSCAGYERNDALLNWKIYILRGAMEIVQPKGTRKVATRVNTVRSVIEDNTLLSWRV